MAIILTLFWALLNCLVQSIGRPIFGGWCWISKQDIRFTPSKRVLHIKGNPGVKDTGVGYALRGRWQETWVVFQVEGGSGLLYCDDFAGKRITYWRAWQGVRPQLLRALDQVACRVAAHDACWGLLGWRGEQQGTLVQVSRCNQALLANYPRAKRI